MREQWLCMSMECGGGCMCREDTQDGSAQVLGSDEGGCGAMNHCSQHVQAHACPGIAQTRAVQLACWRGWLALLRECHCDSMP